MNLPWLAFVNWFASLFPVRQIRGEDGSVYLERFTLFGYTAKSNEDEHVRDYRGLSLYLHRFHRPDDDGATHNHPWNLAISFRVAGSYLEERQSFNFGEPNAVRHSKFISVIQRNTFHRITELVGRETWTLFLVGPRAGSWCFCVPDGWSTRNRVQVFRFKNWREYLAAKSNRGHEC